MSAYDRETHTAGIIGERREPVPHRLRNASLPVLLCSLALLVAACFPYPTSSQTGTGEASTGVTPTHTVSPLLTPVSPSSTITLSVVNCPALTINWDSLVKTQQHINKVQRVICGNLEGNGTVVALVDVRYYAANARLDFYVYDNLFGTPRQAFAVQGLIDGDAEISQQNTIMTAEAGARDAVQTSPDIFKEYEWNGSTFTQILAPYLYPDLSTYQAERDNALALQEQASNQAKAPDLWRFSGSQVTSHLALYIFHWQNTSQQVTLNSKKTDTIVIQVTNGGPGGGGFIATLHHLYGVPTNIVEITQFAPLDGNITLSSPTAGSTVHSPISVSGTTAASGTILGRVVVYTDMFITAGDSGALHNSASSGYVRFTTSVNYTLNASGIQEGLVVFYPTNQNNVLLPDQAVLIPVFLTA
jgi:hypothetical protein